MRRQEEREKIVQYTTWRQYKRRHRNTVLYLHKTMESARSRVKAMAGGGNVSWKYETKKRVSRTLQYLQTPQWWCAGVVWWPPPPPWTGG
jgi:hypothetical protein